MMIKLEDAWISAEDVIYVIPLKTDRDTKRKTEIRLKGNSEILTSLSCDEVANKINGALYPTSHPYRGK